MVINIIGSVRVSKTKKCGDAGGTVAQNQLVVSGCPKVMKDMLEGMLVVGTRVGSVMAKSCNSISEIWPSSQHRVHEGAEGPLVCLGVDRGRSEFEEMLIRQGRGGDGARVLHSIVLQDFVYKFFL